MTLWQQYANCEQFQDKIALRDRSQGEVFNWRQLADKIDQSVLDLQRFGIGIGDGVALCGKNSMELLCYYLAALQSGARVLGINPAFTQDKIRRLCKSYDISLLCIALSPNGDKELIKCGENRPHFSAQPLTLTLTSGSTGLPKAVVHDVTAHLANAQGVCALTGFDSDGSWLLSLPLYHVSGQAIVWRWLQRGAELHLPGEDFYYAVAQAGYVSLVPTQLQRFLTYLSESHPETLNTRCILLGGSEIPLELIRQLDPFAIQSYCGYGMTEMASTVFAKKSDGKTGVGCPLDGREYRLVEGEIWLRGAGLGLGYWQNGRIVSFLNVEGWLQTKDKGYWYDGELVLAGRLDNMFISGGENIQPEEIERLIRRFEGVEEVFILPWEDAEFGYRPVAMVEFKTGFSRSAVNKLQIWLSDKIEKFKQPTAYFALQSEKWRQAGSIKISRQLLKTELNQILGKHQC